MGDGRLGFQCFLQSGGVLEEKNPLTNPSSLSFYTAGDLRDSPYYRDQKSYVSLRSFSLARHSRHRKTPLIRDARQCVNRVPRKTRIRYFCSVFSHAHDADKRVHVYSTRVLVRVCHDHDIGQFVLWPLYSVRAWALGVRPMIGWKSVYVPFFFEE